MSRVTEIRYVGYAVPDLEAERAFYADQWKLVEAGEKDGMVHFAADGGEEAYVVRLRAAADKRIDVIALAADSRADVDALHDRVAASGARISTRWAAAMASASSRPTACPSRFRATLPGARPAPSHNGKACRSGSAISCCTRRTTRPWCSGSATCWASRCRTGWAISCASCAAMVRTTASPSCPDRPASTTSPTTC